MFELNMQMSTTGMSRDYGPVGKAKWHNISDFKRFVIMMSDEDARTVHNKLHMFDELRDIEFFVAIEDRHGNLLSTTRYHYFEDISDAK